MQSLYVCKELVIPFAVALQNLPQDRSVQVLPALRSLSLEGTYPSMSSQEAMEL